ncbi:hypothetical protein ACFZCU_14455 [Streptomyces canus]|uniref:hypothetical protein n=1 Tax=Streptomyces canus TaxID=58343 RepID=UPI0036E652D8
MPWRTLGAARRGHVLGAASGARDAGGGITPARTAPGRGAATRIDSADTTLSGIAATRRNGPITILRRTVSGATPRNRSADAPPSDIAAAGGNDRFTARRRTLGDTTRSAAARRTRPVGVLRHVITDTAPRNRSAAAPPSDIAAAEGNDRFTARRRPLGDTTRSAAARRTRPVGVLRHVITDTAPRDRSAAVGRNGPVGVLRRRGWSRGARWG